MNFDASFYSSKCLIFRINYNKTEKPPYRIFLHFLLSLFVFHILLKSCRGKIITKTFKKVKLSPNSLENFLDNSQ
jgi:hypothetical protein